jgi:hypothetical protein
MGQNKLLSSSKLLDHCLLVPHCHHHCGIFPHTNPKGDAADKDEEALGTAGVYLIHVCNLNNGLVILFIEMVMQHQKTSPVLSI